MIGRLLIIAAGAGVVAAATHANVMRAGGYGSDESYFIISVAALLALGMGYVGAAFNDGRRVSAVLLGLCILAGEAYWVLLNTEREIAARDAAATPVVEARRAYSTALERVERAEVAKQRADAAAIAEAAKKHCAANCAKLLLAGQLATDTELADARAALAVLPVPKSAAPLPERLGIPSWLWDLIMAGLRSLAVVGGSLAIGMAAHPRRRPTRRADHPIADILVPPADKREHTARFLRSTLRPEPSGRASLRRLYARYTQWCAASKIEALPPSELGRELRMIVDAVGLECEQEGDDVIVHGAKLVT